MNTPKRFLLGVFFLKEILMNKNVIIVVVALLVGCCWWWVGKKTGENKHAIAVLKIASHAALDASESAFINAIKEKTGNKYLFVIKNADGSVANAQAIAHGLVARQDVVAFYALGTPSLQSLVHKESERPVLFSAVTYPEKLGLIKGNVVGASDYFDLQELVLFSHKLLPQALRVGILYNPGTEIAQHELAVLEASCTQLGLQPVKIAGITEADILGSLKSNLRKIDMCIAPTDNMIASVLPSIAALCNHEHIPLIAAWQTALEDGALAALGMDYSELGTNVGSVALDILDGKISSQDVGILRARPTGVLNKKLKDYYGKIISMNPAICREEK